MATSRLFGNRMNFSLRSTLVMIAAPPLVAFMLVSGHDIYRNYQSYMKLERQLRIQKLAQAGGNLVLVLPSEATSAPQNLNERRKDTDEALTNLQSTFESWKSEGFRDPVVEETIAFIASKRSEINKYRQGLTQGRICQRHGCPPINQQWPPVSG